MSVSVDKLEHLADMLELFAHTAEEKYGEDITHIEHAIQTTEYLLNQPDAKQELCVAGFWHDIGHSFHRDPAVHCMTDKSTGEILGVHNHDLVGKLAMSPILSKDAAELIGTHTIAKRYSGESDHLSNASAKTLEQEGGPLTQDQREQFESHRLFSQAMKLREGDDNGKKPDWDGGSLGSHGSLLMAIADTIRLMASQHAH